MTTEGPGDESTMILEQAFWESYAADASVDDPDRIQAYMGHFPHGGTSA